MSMILLRRPMLLGAAAILAGAAERAPVSTIPVSRMDTPWWRIRHQEKLADLRARRVDLLWIGDSITQDWERRGPPEWHDFAPVWQRFYGDRNAVNLGFTGDNTAHLLWRMQNGELDNLHPRAIVILIGANNMGRVRWTAPQSMAGIEAVVAECRRRLPSARILLLGVLPSIRNDYVTRTTASVNHTLQQAYGGDRVPDVTFMDVGRLFLKNGAVDPNMFVDIRLTPPDPPLHPSPAAMAMIAEAIEPTLAAMLRDRPKPPMR